MIDMSYFLWQHKGALKFVIPVLLTVDAMHNAVIIWNLYNERLHEWEEERRHAILSLVMPTLRQLHVRCQQQDQAFWPVMLSKASDPPPVCKNLDIQAADFEALGVVVGWPLLTACRDRAIDQISEPSASSGPCEQLHGDLDEINSYPMLLRERCKRALSSVTQQMEVGMGVGIESLQHLVPMPRVQIWRTSALRFRMQWRNVTQPSHGT